MEHPERDETILAATSLRAWFIKRAGGDFGSFLLVSHPREPFTPPRLPFNPQFRLFTASYLTTRLACVIPRALLAGRDTPAALPGLRKVAPRA